MDKDAVKYNELYNAALQWLWLKLDGKKISDYLSQHGKKKIVIYGMSDMGNCLYKDLQNSNVKVLYTIDQGFPKLYYDIECYKLDEVSERDKPDMVIVTIPHIYEKIVDSIRTYFDCEVICITELVYKAMYEN